MTLWVVRCSVLLIDGLYNIYKNDDVEAAAAEASFLRTHAGMHIHWQDRVWVQVQDPQDAHASCQTSLSSARPLTQAS